MTLTDVVNIFLKSNTVFQVYDRAGKPVTVWSAEGVTTDCSGTEEVDRFTWERKTAAGKWELLPLVKIYLL